MKIVVTGAGGFIGGYVATYLKDAGHDVTTPPKGYEGTHFDILVHCGASSPPRTNTQIIEDNCTAMQRLLREYRPQKFIFLSSISLYGDVLTPVLDECTPINNPDLYGRSKLFGELLLESCIGMPSVSLRLPGVIGPKGHTRNWLPRIARQLWNREKIVIYNATGPFNNAVHVNDLAAFIELLIKRDWHGHQTFVLGAGGMTSVQGAVEHLAVVLDVPVDRERVKPKQPPFTICSDKAQGWGYKPLEIGPMLDRYGFELRVDMAKQQEATKRDFLAAHDV